MASTAAILTLLTLTLCCVMSLFTSQVCAKRVKGSLPDNDRKTGKNELKDWIFITRFCFLSLEGKVDFVFKYPKYIGMLQLLLYYDAPGLWENSYRSSKNCSERRKALKKEANQILDLTDERTGFRSAGCEKFTQNGVDFLSCTDTVPFSSARERWWYLVIANCDEPGKPPNTIVLDYELHMTNGPVGDFLHHELSADEFYILPTDISFLLVYWILIILASICAVKLRNRQMLHTTYKMYMVALGLWLFGLFLQCIAWGLYSDSGWEENSTEVTGRVFRAGSTCVFLLVLLLMAKGFTITRGRLTQMSSVRLTIFFSIYVGVNIVLFIWEGRVFDEGLVLYFYESEPGYGFIGLRLCGWLWFTYAFFFTMKHHKNKAKFYIPFYIFYTVWFWAVPILILISIYSINPWARQKIVNGAELLISLCGHLFFLILTRPSAANSNFPFHLRVSQVQFSEDEAPEERYTISEESIEHLNNLFVVSRPAESSAPPASGNVPNNKRRSSQSGASNGNIQTGYSNGYLNGHNLQLEQMFTTQRSGQLPPLTSNGTAAAPPEENRQVGTPADETNAPPSHNKIPDHMPAHETVASAPPSSDNNTTALSNGDGNLAPSLIVSGHDDAPAFTGDGDGSHLPPMNSDSEPHLPPLNSDSASRLPPQNSYSNDVSLVSDDGDQLLLHSSSNNMGRSRLPPLGAGPLPPLSRASAPNADDVDNPESTE